MRALFGRYPKAQLSHTVAIMNRTPLIPSRPFSHSAAPSLFGRLEWGALPSLNRHESDFDDAPPAAPFAEPIRGLHVREIDGSDVFCHFFGRAAISH